MLRLIIPIVFIILFVCWFLFRLIIKKDLKKNLNTAYLGFFFIAIWGLMYWLLLK